MKRSISGVMAGGLFLSLVAATAQTPGTPAKTNDSRAEAIELLRRTIAEQNQNPNRIIREPGSGPAQASPLTRTGLEQQYLDGKLTAKQYQKALDRLQEDERKRAAEADKRRALEALQQDQAEREARKAKAAKTAATPPKAEANRPPSQAKAGAPAVAAAPASAPAQPRSDAVPLAPVAPAPTGQQAKISEVEARLDEMIRLKAQREKAGSTNAAGAAKPGPAAAQTKRQRLDALLKQFIDGTISEADYKEKRAKVLASPE